MTVLDLLLIPRSTCAKPGHRLAQPVTSRIPCVAARPCYYDVVLSERSCQVVSCRMHVIDHGRKLFSGHMIGEVLNTHTHHDTQCTLSNRSRHFDLPAMSFLATKTARYLTSPFSSFCIASSMPASVNGNSSMMGLMW